MVEIVKVTLSFSEETSKRILEAGGKDYAQQGNFVKGLALDGLDMRENRILQRRLLEKQLGIPPSE